MIATAPAVCVSTFALTVVYTCCIISLSPAVTSQHTGGPYLGLEPGLGLTAPFLDQHKREKAATAGDGSYAATPNSVAASESLQPFARVSLSHAAVAPAAATGGAAADAAAAAAAVTEAAEEKKAAGFRKLQQSGRLVTS